MTAATVLSAPLAPFGLPRLLDSGGAPVAIADHLNAHGGIPYRGGPGLLVTTIEQAGIGGRGGAGFPSARKLHAVRTARGRAVVVANGAEGEPASAKDKQLLWSAPHLVLDGLQLAAETVGADVTYLYVHDNPRLLAGLRGAIDDRRARRLDRLPVHLVAAPARFLAGQETAVVHAINGGAPVPTFAPVRVSERGVRGRPTLVQNVETLAHVALAARYGADWFRTVGTADEPGSLLTTVHDVGIRAVVREVAFGTPLRRLVSLDEARAVLVGGYHGTWIDATDAGSAVLANADLRPRGASVGAGVVAVLPDDRCGLVETARVLRYLAVESAGQCGPCLNGLPRIAAALTDLADGRAQPGVDATLLRWSGLVEGRGACAHPDGSVRLVRSALTVFADEVRHHTVGRCTARSHDSVLPVPRSTPGSTPGSTARGW